MTRTIVVINGMNGAAVEVQPLAAALSHLGTVHTPDLLGHGGRPLPPTMGTQEVIDDLVAWLDRERIGPAFFVGFSLGGLFSLYLARHYPERVLGVCGIATKYIFDQETVDRWLYLMAPERIDRPDNPRAEELRRAHFPADWKQVQRAGAKWTLELQQQPPLTDDDLCHIRAQKTPVMLFSGTEDPIVPLPEQRQLAKLLGCPLGVFPGAAHPIRRIPRSVPRLIGEWIAQQSPASTEIT